MTYNEWRDELKSNLLSVSDSERRRVLDYYAEAYADRRDAGFSEREIIEEFGAPYDAAQRILAENSDGYYYEEPQKSREDIRRERHEAERRRREEERLRRHEEAKRRHDECRCGKQVYDEYDDYGYNEPPRKKKQADDVSLSWVFVLLCIIFSVPLFIVVLSMAFASVALCFAPFGILISGVATIGTGIGALFHNALSGAVSIGTGLILLGLGLVLIPLMIKLVKLMWKLFSMFMGWVKRLFGRKERA